ncbi:TylF/MycF/NovP-related O-methyltransferase [Paraburkholderia sp. RL17-381-BIF-C]|uniref:TylF/MycF/NovP-related O-methyltransferase n=1 Tax=Paraburkholderia sp. RL17-381-BIF-C TaxID=3031635 RepID=UPI0038B7C2D1
MELNLPNPPRPASASSSGPDPRLSMLAVDNERAYVYQAMIRRYIGGAADLDDPAHRAPARAAPITADDCAERLAEADRVFAEWLAPRRCSAADIAGIEPSRMAHALNHMHQESRRLTMCDDVLLDNVVELARVVIDERVPGDFIETGVWRGGVTILMRAALTAFGGVGRGVWVADSFAGLPAPDPVTDLRDAIWHHLMRAVGLLRSDLATVREAFARVGLLDRRVRFLPGWFADTLPDAPIERLALMRLDGDWYESTRVALESLYPRLSPGGFVIVDDYGLPTGCARAVDEYRSAHRIDAPLMRVNAQAVYWRKPW